jgi:hypothetical protein
VAIFLGEKHETNTVFNSANDSCFDNSQITPYPKAKVYAVMAMPRQDANNAADQMKLKNVVDGLHKAI